MGGEGDRYQELFERSADAILIIEGETFVDCNQAAIDMLGYASKIEVLQTHPSELSPPTQPDGRDSFSKANEMIATARAQGSHRFEWTHLRRGGEAFPVEVLLTAVEGGEEPVLHVVWRDLSDRWRLEEELRQSQKMEAVGKLASGIAHDFNNLLVAILGNCHIIERTQEPKVVERAAGQIRDASDRAATLVRQLMAFSHQRARTREHFELREAIRGMVPLLERTIGEHISIELALEDPGWVCMERSQVDQIVFNLVANSRDAMPEGGTIHISLREVEGKSTRLPAGTWAELSVIDSGSGMEEAVMRRAFEPFFTTKELGQGTGFGLSTVYGIATHEGGSARIESEPGKGTTATVWVPTARPVDEDRVVAPSPQAPEQVVGRILFVEDDPLIGELIAEELRERGLVVHLATSGRTALEALERVGMDSIDLIVTDVVMPAMSGPAFIQELRDAGRCPPVLFVSGYTGRELEVLEGKSIEFMGKPYSPEELLARIAGLLPSA